MISDHIASGIQPLQVLLSYIHTNEKNKMDFQESVCVQTSVSAAGQ